MYGIDKLKNALKVIINFGESFEAKLDDGKVSWVEGFGLIKDLKDFPQVIKDYKEIWQEIQDLDAVEKSELLEFVQAELDLQNDRVESLIEKCLAFAASANELVTEIRNSTPIGGGGGTPPPKP